MSYVNGRDESTIGAIFSCSYLFSLRIAYDHTSDNKEKKGFIPEGIVFSTPTRQGFASPYALDPIGSEKDVLIRGMKPIREETFSYIEVGLVYTKFLTDLKNGMKHFALYRFYVPCCHRSSYVHFKNSMFVCNYSRMSWSQE